MKGTKNGPVNPLSTAKVAYRNLPSDLKRLVISNLTKRAKVTERTARRWVGPAKRLGAANMDILLDELTLAINQLTDRISQ
jgi:hypothetical protein